MQQIADWLEKLGMSEYAQRFAENKIDVVGATPSDRPRPQGYRGRRSDIAERCSRRSRSLLVPPRQSRSLSLQQSRRPKIPPSAGKSR